VKEGHEKFEASSSRVVGDVNRVIAQRIGTYVNQTSAIERDTGACLTRSQTVGTQLGVRGTEMKALATKVSDMGAKVAGGGRSTAMAGALMTESGVDVDQGATRTITSGTSLRSGALTVQEALAPIVQG
jgi:hypothetical protein